MRRERKRESTLVHYFQKPAMITKPTWWGCGLGHVGVPGAILGRTEHPQASGDPPDQASTEAFLSPHGTGPKVATRSQRRRTSLRQAIPRQRAGASEHVQRNVMTRNSRLIITKNCFT